MNGFLILKEILSKRKLNNYFIIVLYKIHLRPSVIMPRQNLEIQSRDIAPQFQTGLIYLVCQALVGFLLGSFLGF